MRSFAFPFLLALTLARGASAACPAGQVAVPGGCIDPEQAAIEAEKTAKQLEGKFDEGKLREELEGRLRTVGGYDADNVAETVADAVAPGKRGMSGAAWYQSCIQNCRSCENAEAQCSQGAALLPQ